MDADLSGLDRNQVEALIGRLFAELPHVESQAGPDGTVYFVRLPRDTARSPDVRMCAIATDGGVLLRLDPGDREDYVATGSVVPNAALPDWVSQVAVYTAARSRSLLEDIRGDPEEWAWIPVVDEHGFTKRRPIILEAAAYARHCLEHGVPAASGDGESHDAEHGAPSAA